MNKQLKRKSILRKPSLLSNHSITDIEEDKVIADVLTTPYELVIRALTRIKTFLHENNNKEEINSLITDLNYCIHKIQTHSLYTYDMNESSAELEKLSKNSHELQSFIHYLHNFSETKEIKRRNKVAMTVKEKSKVIIKKTSFLNSNDKSKYFSQKTLHKNYDNYNTNSEQGENFYKNQLKLLNDENKNNESLNLEIPDLSPDILFNGEIINNSDNNLEHIDNFSNALSNFNINLKEKNVLNFSTNKDDVKDNKNESNIDKNRFVSFSQLPVNSPSKWAVDVVHVDSDNSKINDNLVNIEFNIFDFVSEVGMDEALEIGTKNLMEYLNINTLIDPEKLNSFLRKVKSAYKNNPYHNEMHGLDVCQTTCSYLVHSPIIEVLQLTDLDILCLVIGSLVHDIAHPGTNNAFLINSFSDLAITYNDKSILENFHIAETFKIIKDDNCNIFSNYNNENFKLIRKRIIELILATDMTCHAKINGTIKNKLQINKITDGENIEKLINPNSDMIFDEQQEIINFLVHTADLSHNSKHFDISKKWTYLLMEEMWNQGDRENELNLPVSFLCDRNTAEVPKSQIGFIKGIIIPTFDLLIEMFPALQHTRFYVESNLIEWGLIVEEENRKKAITEN